MGSSCQKPTENIVSHHIREGKSLLNDLKFIRVIKRNRISTVWVVESKRQKTFYALKVIDKTQIAKLNCASLPINEQLVLSKLNSTFITNCYSTFQDSKKLYFLLEYMPYGNLRDFLEFHCVLTQKQARFLVLCILNGLDYLSLQEVVHLDLKPENIVIDSKGYFRLCDFNLSRILKYKKSIYTRSGTYGYQAPEILHQKHRVAYSADYYSLGVILFECLSGENPRNFQISEENVRKYFQDRKNVTDECIQFIIGLITQDPNNRLGNKTIYDIWQHPWLALEIYQKREYEKKTIESPISKKYYDFYQRKSLSNSNRNTDDEGENSDSSSFDKTVQTLKLNDLKFQRKFQKFKAIDKRLIP